MDLLQLRYFQTVARLENVTHAAEELHIAQPCISRAIARLEDSVGVALFERTGKRIRLNEFGRVFLKRVERCFNELEEGQRELADLAGAKRGKIVVGATVARILPGLFGEFLKTRPTVQFQLFQAASQQDVQKRLLGGEIDLCFTAQPVELPEAHDEPLFSEEIILAVGEGHRLAKKKSVRLEELSGEALIDLGRNASFVRL
jgi:DNA-binding transcriptional LysR family regulator